MSKLQGKVTVITGGTSGIGLATAKRYVAEGAYVFITGRRQAELDAAVKEIGSNVTGVRGDVANLSDLDRLYETVKASKGHIDVLFANAGVGEFLPLGAITEEHFDQTFGVNVRGTLRQPRMTFFSDPEVAQSQIVSLLLAGGSLESVQNTSTTTDPTARSSASRADLMQGGAILAQQIGGRYDIEAGVEQDLDNETSLVLGRYLSPRLYVSYGVGLAEAINTIKMRYTIGDHWTVKTEAGTQRSADLVYTIER